ncbi:MAG: bifunctional hydroxymethylpyrimidine kinase/phosphomethylpyrimidine kinase [Aigarchaeota archaeon]|nr:bifunctional hydroxymethylpyrimidine kinase/phosphomethylpyrimidine kinase [Aigarchaeota archaeon]MDW8093229.1 bifunctional hydroxymethylpyrimidine kinase/phosphomethylpyrimidine kinase [Nitrososphaerota archaeon]
MDKPKVPRALTIAGSDSGGGAGIQADLKTFAALGVHGMSAITCITAQNTAKVTQVVPLDARAILEQVRVCVEDIGVDAIKTGMLFSASIIEAVTAEVARLEVPIVVDPVMVAKSGAQLLRDDAIEAMKGLISVATVVTPNAYEARLLTGLEIKSVEDQIDAARSIAGWGSKAVVVKGGHLYGDEVVDVLLYGDRVFRFVSKRIDTKNTHGTGCVFASAIAAELAKGRDVVDAVGVAKEFVTSSIAYSFAIGRGSGPVNPIGSLIRDAEIHRAIERLQKAVRTLEGLEGAGTLAPESMINLAESLPYPRDHRDVIAIPGRLVRIDGYLRASGPPSPGASRHVASALLEISNYDSNMRSAMNIKFDESIINIVERLNFSVSSYDRSREPPEVKRVEGATVRWGIREAVRSAGKVTDVIYHMGDYGKEPMILIIGRDSLDVVDKFKLILREYLKV